MNAHARDVFDRITETDVFEASEIVLACLLSNGTTLSDAGLEEEDFEFTLHQFLFREAMELIRRSERVNWVSLKPHLPKYADGLDCSPAEYAKQLSIKGTDPVVRLRLDSSIDVVKGAALGRQLAKEAEVVADLAKEGHSLLTLDDEIEQLEQRLRERRQRFSALKAGVAPGSSYLAKFEASARRNGVVGVPIALPEIASVLSEPAFEAGNLYGLLSSSGEGKSSLTMQLIYHAVDQGHPVLFLSYDQDAAQCTAQMIAQVHGISMRKQREPMRLMTDAERETCVAFATEINHKPLDIIRCQREGVDKLVAYARRFIKKRANGRTPFIVIDHIGKVKPKDAKLSADRISGDITVELKAIAYELGASILVLNQRNGEGDRRSNPRPIAKDLYGGTNARADYDAILTLYRPEKYKKEMEKVAASANDWKIINSVFGSDIEGVAEIAAIKVRFGPPDISETVRFEADYTRYVSQTPKRSQQEMFT